MNEKWRIENAALQEAAMRACRQYASDGQIQKAAESMAQCIDAKVTADLYDQVYGQQEPPKEHP